MKLLTKIGVILVAIGFLWGLSIPGFYAVDTNFTRDLPRVALVAFGVMMTGCSCLIWRLTQLSDS